MIRVFIFLLISCVFCARVKAQNDPWRWKSPRNYPAMVIEGDTLSPPPALSYDTWWQQFGYQQLDELQSAVYLENLEIKVMQNRVLQAQATVKAARAVMMPAVSISPSATREELSANRPIGFDAGDLPQVWQNTFSLPVLLRYEVDLFGRNGNAIKAAKFDLLATKASKKDLTLQITSQMAQQYFTLVTLDTEQIILERTVRIREDNLDIVQTRYQAGLVNAIDVQRARTELATVVVARNNNRLLRSEIELAIATLCGQSPSTFSIPATPLQYLPPVVQPDAPDVIIQQRPDIQQIDNELKAAEQSLKNRRKQLYPSLSLNGSWGYVSADTENLFNDRSTSWLLGGTLSIPVFEGWRRRAELDINKQNLEASQNLLTLQALRAQQEIENLASNLSRLQQQLSAQQDFQEAAQQAALLTKARYTKGLVTYLEVVDAERVVLDAEQLSVQLIGDILINTIRLMVAQGEGEKPD